MPSRPHHGILAKRSPAIRRCIYTFVAGPRQRVKLDFEQFQLAGTADNCETEYVDIYSELESPHDDLLSASFGGRYCGSVSPYVRISLHRVIVLVFHSRAASNRRSQLKFRGHYSFISDARYNVGHQTAAGKCGFIIDSKSRKRGTILSPTYPGTYPKNFHCSYLLNGKPGQRIRFFFRDFDIYFGGEHCPYDSMTIYDGTTNKAPIVRKVCGLQQRLEVYSLGPNAFLEFNTTSTTKADPRGYVIDYEFSSRYVDVLKLLDNEKGVTHLRGSECDVRVESNRETTHYIHSPKFPHLYPANTTCTYIIDGLQGEQNLEKVLLTFEKFAVLSESSFGAVGTSQKHSADYDEEICATAYVGIAMRDTTIKSVLASGEESSYDATLCDRLPEGSEALGPYVSDGPRMVLVFSSFDRVTADKQTSFGFRAKIQFKTDFGIPGDPVGDSNKCLFKFTKPQGSFNSPRYPANYPLDTNCTYFIKASPGQQIQVYFEQFALYSDGPTSDGDKYCVLSYPLDTNCTYFIKASPGQQIQVYFEQFALYSDGPTSDGDKCADFLEIFDVFMVDGMERLQLQAKYCAQTFPGPTVSAFGSYEMRVFFRSDSQGTGNGFKALYKIRKAFKEEIPTRETSRHCGQRITRTDDRTTGWLVSPGYPIKYNKDLICDWEVKVRPGHRVLLNLVKMEVEGAMTGDSVNCQNAVIRVDADRGVGAGPNVQEICGTVESVIQPIVSNNNTVRISFFTSPDKVNGLKGFNFTWTEVKLIKDDRECSDPSLYLCTYTKLCIDARLRCNGDENCGLHDDTDEAHCNKLESATDIRTVLFAATFSGCIFLFIFGFFCYLFKKKFERKKKKRRRYASSGLKHQRQPYRSQKPVSKAAAGRPPDIHLLPSPAASRLTHHDITGVMPLSNHHAHTSVYRELSSHQPRSETFYG
ncbi:Cubilin [Toxocara canis]|uniref:Cubilin n=1 Tax=Toxocara canis TaxID=6265 RepID=A0A0B2UTZ1_TOXCA|nr:Cubilin [Toxocara canis]